MDRIGAAEHPPRPSEQLSLLTRAASTASGSCERRGSGFLERDKYPSLMRQELLDAYLACPLDRTAPLVLGRPQWDGRELAEGELTCPTCRAVFPIESGVPDMRPPVHVQTQEAAIAKDRESKARDLDSVNYDSVVPAYQTRLEIGALLEALAVQPTNAVLDLGAGTGRLTLDLARTGATVLAMDLSPRSLAANRAKCATAGLDRVHHIVVDACFLPLRNSVADKAGSAAMLEHLPSSTDRSRCLDELRRCLKPGGSLAMSVYNYSLRKRRKYPREGFHGQDLYFYNLDGDEMRRLLKGFKVRELTGLLNLPGKLRWHALDRLVSRVPPLALLLGQFLCVAAVRED